MFPSRVKRPTAKPLPPLFDAMIGSLCPFCGGEVDDEYHGAVRERFTDVKLDIMTCRQCNRWFFLSQGKESEYVQGFYEEECATDVRNVVE